MNWLLELLWPPARMQRIERELNARERDWIAKMTRDLHERQTREAIESYKKPMLFSEILNGDQS